MKNGKASSGPWLPDASNSRLPGSCQPTSIPRGRGDGWTLWIIRIKSKHRSLTSTRTRCPFLTGKSYINNNDLILRLYPPPRSVYVQGLYGIRRASVSIGSRDTQGRPSIDGHGSLALFKLPFPSPPTSLPAGVLPMLS